VATFPNWWPRRKVGLMKILKERFRTRRGTARSYTDKLVDGRIANVEKQKLDNGRTVIVIQTIGDDGKTYSVILNNSELVQIFQVAIETEGMLPEVRFAEQLIELGENLEPQIE
jgi:hypothetical protein